jgi:hypothetical protein
VGANVNANSFVDPKAAGPIVGNIVAKFQEYLPGIPQSEVQRRVLGLIAATTTADDGKISTYELKRWDSVLDFSQGPQNTLAKLGEVKTTMAMKRAELEDSLSSQIQPQVTHFPAPPNVDYQTLLQQAQQTKTPINTLILRGWGVPDPLIQHGAASKIAELMRKYGAPFDEAVKAVMRDNQ